MFSGSFPCPFYSVLLGCIIRVLLLFGLGWNKDSRGNGPVPGGPHRKARQLRRTADKWLTCGLCDDKGRHQPLETWQMSHSEVLLGLFSEGPWVWKQHLWDLQQCCVSGCGWSVNNLKLPFTESAVGQVFTECPCVPGLESADGNSSHLFLTTARWMGQWRRQDFLAQRHTRNRGVLERWTLGWQATSFVVRGGLSLYNKPS